jgi:LEA14-like dessication related protein
MRWLRILLIFGLLFYLVQCADVLKVLNQAAVQKPSVKIAQTRLSALSFEQVDLVFDIEIDNPNSMGVSLAGFDYDLLLNNQSFLKGDQQKQMEIKAQDKATIEFPLTLQFHDIYTTYQRLKSEDEIGYTLKTGFSFDLPVLGVVRIPVSASGRVPMVKLPVIRVQALKLENLTLSGASFELQLGLDNPNSWGVLLKGLDYHLAINGSEWISGKIEEKMNLAAKRTSPVTLPFSISFLKIGSSVYNVIAGGRGLNYNLSGGADLVPSIELLSDLKLPFDLSGKVDISK